MNQQINNLISLADEALSYEAQGEKAIKALGNYVEAFGNWLKENGGELSKFTKTQRAELIMLQKKHEAVLSRATELKDLTQTSIKNVRTRGKSIAAYISVSKGKPTRRKRRKL